MLFFYQLELKNIHINEKNTIEDTDFLMEVMETNEALTEVRSKEDLEGIRINNNGKLSQPQFLFKKILCRKKVACAI